MTQALAMDSKIMLFDEVTSALDPELVGNVLAVMQQLARDVADPVVFMDGGVIVEEGAPGQMFAAPRTDRVRQFLKRYNDRYRL
ncbi:MAG: hypothetical protein P4L90_00165 [Rhodopila sp.]|nr:hypothetical protein [Rhodopila sp.]